MYEEPDYALQCIDRGFEVALFPVITVRHHFASASRSEQRNHRLHARNECWSAFLRCPLPVAPLIAFYRVISQGRYAVKRGFTWLIREPVWWWAAMVNLPVCISQRQPVKWCSYRRWLKLLRHPEPVI
jgi:hypothetical protein